MRKLRTMHLFAGAGGGLLADVLLGHQPVCAVEIDEYCQQVLSARQEDGCFPWFPIFEDVQVFDGRPWRGIVDVVCGGFPCQDISAAGRGAGIDGERSGLWREMARIVGEVRPRYVFVENSPLLVGRGLAVVLGDLAEMGYDAQWACISASDTGAPHQRDRVWIVANHRGGRFGRPEGRQVEQPWRAEAISAGDESEILADAPSDRSQRRDTKRKLLTESFDGSARKNMADSNGMRQPQPQGLERNEWRWAGNDCEAAHLAHGHGHGQQRMVEESQPSKLGRPTGLHRGTGEFPAWPADPADAPESGLGRVVDRMAHRSHRLKAIGNGQVPLCAATAWRLLANI